ncbi:MAG: RNA polymerase sigma-70 factor [Bacteroidota bacterium]|nr:RNA polymerase sigma-70 factor [Bacteroidota bacterium]
MENFEKHFGVFYNENYNKAFRYANSFVFDKEVAKDIASDSMLKIWEIQESINPDKNLNALLFVSIRNKCLDHLRHEQVKQKSSVEFGLYILESTTPADFYSKELTIMVQRAVDTLQETTRNCFLMVRMNGQSYKEVADALNISTRSVEYELKRAGETMKRLLADFL